MIDPNTAPPRQRLRLGRARPVLRIAFLTAILAAAAGTLAASPASAAPITTSHINGAAPASSNHKLRHNNCNPLIYCGPANISASWQYQPGTGAGTVTVQGAGFSPGGLVSVTYNYGSGSYQQWTTASVGHRQCIAPGVCYWVVGGFFTITEPDILCGAIPGAPNGIGVYIDAYDVRSQADAQTAIQTPCQ